MSPVSILFTRSISSSKTDPFTTHTTLTLDFASTASTDSTGEYVLSL